MYCVTFVPTIQQNLTPTAEVRLKFRNKLCGIYGEQSGIGTDFSQRDSVFAVSIMLHVHSTKTGALYI